MTQRPMPLISRMGTFVQNTSISSHRSVSRPPRRPGVIFAHTRYGKRSVLQAVGLLAINILQKDAGVQHLTGRRMRSLYIPTCPVLPSCPTISPLVSRSRAHILLQPLFHFHCSNRMLILGSVFQHTYTLALFTPRSPRLYCSPCSLLYSCFKATRLDMFLVPAFVIRPNIYRITLHGYIPLCHPSGPWCNGHIFPPALLGAEHKLRDPYQLIKLDTKEMMSAGGSPSPLRDQWPDRLASKMSHSSLASPSQN